MEAAAMGLIRATVVCRSPPVPLPACMQWLRTALFPFTNINISMLRLLPAALGQTAAPKSMLLVMATRPLPLQQRPPHLQLQLQLPQVERDHNGQHPLAAAAVQPLLQAPRMPQAFVSTHGGTHPALRRHSMLISISISIIMLIMLIMLPCLHHRRSMQSAVRLRAPLPHQFSDRHRLVRDQLLLRPLPPAERRRIALPTRQRPRPPHRETAAPIAMECLRLPQPLFRLQAEVAVVIVTATVCVRISSLRVRPRLTAWLTQRNWHDAWKLSRESGVRQLQGQLPQPWLLVRVVPPRGASPRQLRRRCQRVGQQTLDQAVRMARHLQQ